MHIQSILDLKKFPIIEFDNFILREIDPEQDFEQYYDYMSHDMVSEFIADNIRVNSADKALRDLMYWHSVFHEGASIYWCIASPIDNKMIGTVGFNHISVTTKTASISYDLNVEFWGKGIMRKSIEAICQFIHDTFGIKKVEATVVKQNLKSIKALEKTGFMFYSMLYSHEVIEGKPHDSFVYIKNLDKKP